MGLVGLSIPDGVALFKYQYVFNSNNIHKEVIDDNEDDWPRYIE